MIRFNSVTMRNFLSYGNNPTTISLDQAGTVLIMGENMDSTSDGSSRNGTGKTTIINAIVFALYDKTISDIAKDNLINNINKRNMEVSVDFTVGTTNYVVRRERKTKGSTNIYLFIDGEDKTPDSSGKTNAEIIRIVGMPFEMFVRIVVFSAQQESFLEMPTRHPTQANQTDFIEELFGLTTLSAKANALKLVIADTERAIDSEKSRISLLERHHTEHTTQLESAKRRLVTWEVTNTQSVTDLQAKLDKIGDIDIVAQQVLLNELRTNKQEHNDLMRAVTQLNNQTLKLKQTVINLNAELVQLQSHECPYCHQEFLDTKQKILTTTESIASTNQTLVDVNNQTNIALGRMDDLSDIIAGIQQHITIDNLEELIGIHTEQSNIERKIQELQIANNPYLEPLEELVNMKVEEVDYTEMNKLTDLQAHQKFLLKLLTKKDSFVRKELLDKNIPYLNTRLQHYLGMLGLPHKVEFTKEMTAAISQFGQAFSFGNLSAGQRARVNIALSLAFRDVLQQLHQKINICLFDEVLDIGLDSVGIIAAARVLKQISKEDDIAMFIISHKNEVETMFDEVMTVQLIKGFSYIRKGNGT